MNHIIDRRGFLRSSALAWLASIEGSAWRSPQSATARGRMLGTVPFTSEGAPQPLPFGEVLGAGLDARLLTDLSGLTPATLITPNARFFVRTTRPGTLQAQRSWTIDLGGLVRTPRAVDLHSIAGLVRPMGTHLLECAGNTGRTSFGLMSAARWEGIPLAALLDRVTPLASERRIEVTGVDDLTQRSQTSVPGASWIFSRDDLDRAGAFLATRMNGATLPPDHGFPARLVVPGWYGCACIKWVNRIDVVTDDAPATTQMVEFARRTHQDGEPALAREFTPAVVDRAAMPVRVERWTADGKILYRVVGVLWGGPPSKAPAHVLSIRFKAGEPWVLVDDGPAPASSTTWSLWTHWWRPREAGTYQIVLRVNDPSVRTRRLDLFFYTREVEINDV